MKHSAPLPSFSFELSPLRAAACAVSLMLGMTGVASAAVTAGSLAVVGYSDYGFEDGFDDNFTVAALDTIQAGTVLYFTNNGWNATNGMFLGAGNGTGHGEQQLLKLTVSSTIAAGTILRSGFDDTGYTWDAFGSITDGSGNFSMLNLDSTGAGDQIHVFTGAESNPLLNAALHIYQLDTGDFSSPFFEDAVSSATGAVAPGLFAVGNTAFMLPDSAAGNDAADFHNGSFALDMSSPTVSALQLSGGTKAQWLSVIADSNNWTRINYEDDNFGDAESQLSSMNTIPDAAPEPSRAVLMFAGLMGVFFRRRR